MAIDRKRISKILIRALIGIASLLTFLILFGPLLAKVYINHSGERLIGREIALKGLYHNPFTGYTRLSGFAIYEQDQTSAFIAFDTLIIDTDLYKLFSDTLSVSQIRLTGPYVQVIQDGDQFNFADILEKFQSEETNEQLEEENDEPPDSEKMAYKINNISLVAGEVKLMLDQQPFHLERINFHTPGIYFDNRETDADLDLDFHGGGQLHVFTALNAEEETFEVQLDLEKLALEPSEILQLYTTISSQKGFVDAHLNVSGNIEAITDLTFQGDISLADFEIQDEKQQTILAGDQVKVEFAPSQVLQQEVRMKLIEVSNPYIFCELFKDSTSTFTRLMKESEEPEPEVPETTTVESDSAQSIENDGINIAIKELRVHGGKIAFKDYKPYNLFEGAFSEVEVKGDMISSETNSLIDISARAAAGGRIKATYEGNLFVGGDYAYSVEATIVELSSFSPYTVTYFDRPIEKGQFTVTATTHVIDDYMKGLFTMLGSDIVFGPPAKTKSLYDMPLKMGMFLMEDKNGNVHMEIPVEGDANNPNKPFIRILMDSFFDEIMKVVNAPTKFLGNIIGTGNKISKIEYHPIHLTITADIGSILDYVVDALIESPELTLRLEQEFDEKQATTDLAVFEVKSDFYNFKYESSAVSDFYSIDAIGLDEKEFREYVSKQSKSEINSSEDMVNACLTLKKNGLKSRTKGLSQEWNKMISEYLTENDVPQDQFSIKTVKNTKGHFTYKLDTNHGKIKKK